jgi:hypothetical protein
VTWPVLHVVKDSRWYSGTKMATLLCFLDSIIDEVTLSNWIITYDQEFFCITRNVQLDILMHVQTMDSFRLRELNSS